MSADLRNDEGQRGPGRSDPPGRLRCSAGSSSSSSGCSLFAKWLRSSSRCCSASSSPSPAGRWSAYSSGVASGTEFALALAIFAVPLAVILLAACVAALSVGELVVQIPRYESRLNAAVAALQDQLTQLGIGADAGAITAIISPERIFAFVRPVASAVSEAGGAMFVVAFTVIYALAGGTSLRARAAAAFGEHHPLVLGTERFATDLRRYLVVHPKLGLFAAVLSFVLLFVLGVPFPVLWRSSCSPPASSPEHRLCHRSHPAGNSAPTSTTG